jgi:hypothetical protein
MSEGSEDYEGERPGAHPEGESGAERAVERAERDFERVEHDLERTEHELHRAERELRHEEDHHHEGGGHHEHHHGHGQHHHESDEFEIKVNGRTHKVKGKRQDYREIAGIAYPNPDFTNFLYTITYLNGVHDASGDLVEGEHIEIKNEMVFNVRRSDKS